MKKKSLSYRSSASWENRGERKKGGGGVGVKCTRESVSIGLRSVGS
jgi:hypothetical protein